MHKASLDHVIVAVLLINLFKSILEILKFGNNCEVSERPCELLELSEGQIREMSHRDR